MNRRTASILVILLLCIGIGLELLGLRAASEAKARLAVEMSRREEVESMIRKQQTASALIQVERDRLEAAMGELRKPQPRAGASKLAPGVPNVPALEAAVRDPELTELYLRHVSAVNSWENGFFHALLNLSPAQGEALDAIETKRVAQTLDLKGAQVSQGLDVTDPAVVGINKQNAAEMHQAQQALLGPEGYAQLQHYQQVTPLFGAVMDMQGYLVAQGGEPINNTQAAQLIQLIANTSSSYLDGKALDVQQIDWPSAVAQASSFLSTKQVEVLEKESEIQQAFQFERRFFAQQQSGKK